MERCVVRWSIWSNGVVAFIGLGFVIPVIMIMNHTGPAEDAAIWACLVFFSYIAFLFGRRTVGRRPVLTVDEHGISLIRYGLITWSDIAEVDVIASSPNVLAIRVHDLEKWQRKIPLFLRAGWRFFPKWKQLCVSLQNVDTATSKILLAVESFFPKKADEQGYVAFTRETDADVSAINTKNEFP